MIAKSYSCALLGLEPMPIHVEIGLTGGLPDLVMVGLPDTAVRESRERVRSAIVRSGFSWPKRRILVNLAPAHLRKAGSGYDLAVAVGILKASGQLDISLADYVFVGELSIDGLVRPIRGILAMALAMRSWPQKTLVVAEENLAEARRGTSRVIALQHLSQTKDLYRMKEGKESDLSPAVTADEGFPADMQDVVGQYQARRALEIAACGRHNLLLTGPPGSGKSLLARCLPSILPPLTEPEALEINQIYSVAGLLNDRRSWICRRPFRSPHARITKAGMFGGGWPFKPGEISLAHKGILYLDEMPEFNRSVLEGLRQPLEEGVVTVSQSWGSIAVPADFQLIGSANPCYCGYYGDGFKDCTCTGHQLKQYKNKLSGPLIDRIDMLVQVPRADLSRFMENHNLPESSAQVRERVRRVWAMQQERKKNARNELRLLQQSLTGDAKALLQGIYQENGLTARGYKKVLQLARTISDMENEEMITEAAIAEALQFRGEIE